MKHSSQSVTHLEYWRLRAGGHQAYAWRGSLSAMVNCRKTLPIGIGGLAWTNAMAFSMMQIFGSKAFIWCGCMTSFLGQLVLHVTV